MQIEYQASDHVRAVIAAMGRTEDVRFSPNNRRLAVAAFNRGRIVVFGIDIATTAVTLTSAIEIESPALNYPHGVDFIDDETLVVANRNGDVAVFAVPLSGACSGARSPIAVLRGDEGARFHAPGSLAVVRGDPSRCALLVCNNAGHTVTRHRVDRGAGCSIHDGAVLLRKWLNLPDGVCVSHDAHWIAVSNHNTHDVLLYRNAPTLDERTLPDGALRGAYYPHGLRFSADGRHLFVADAGAPYIHIYAADGQGWRGARGPALSLRIMDEATYALGRQNPQEGGPKGIDLDAGMNLLVATSEHQPMAMFDVRAILARTPASPPAEDIEYERGILAYADRLRTMLAEAEARTARAEARAAKANARLAALKKRWPHRITASLGRIYSALKQPN